MATRPWGWVQCLGGVRHQVVRLMTVQKELCRVDREFRKGGGGLGVVSWTAELTTDGQVELAPIQLG